MSTQIMYMNVHASMIPRTPEWKQPKWTHTKGWINKICIRAMEYSSAIERKEGLMHATAWVDLKNVMLGLKKKKKTE